VQVAEWDKGSAGRQHYIYMRDTYNIQQQPSFDDLSEDFTLTPVQLLAWDLQNLPPNTFWRAHFGVNQLLQRMKSVREENQNRKQVKATTFGNSLTRQSTNFEAFD
jgi:hypothetical protein